MLYYIPLEPLIERYTWQWSAPVTGWLERRWIEAGIRYTRINGTRRSRNQVVKGVVLDAVARSEWCFSQIEQLLHLADQGVLTSDDVIYFDDFWTPGMEALPYLFEQIGIKPKMYSFLFAQSVDKYDFTHPMLPWIRDMEKGYGQLMDGIFVTCQFLKDLVVNAGISTSERVHVTGHPFCSEEVSARMPFSEGPWECVRRNKVVFSSRWDWEKRPWFFLKMARRVKETMPDAEFVICTGSQSVRSNDEANLERLYKAEEEGIVTVAAGLSKEDYYRHLCEAKVQFNCALQDFVPLTLLEASTAGCFPVYPYFRSFPATFRSTWAYMYDDGSWGAAAKKVERVLASDSLWTEHEIKARRWIHEPFDTAWRRQLIAMGLMEGEFDELS